MCYSIVKVGRLGDRQIPRTSARWRPGHQAVESLTLGPARYPVSAALDCGGRDNQLLRLAIGACFFCVVLVVFLLLGLKGFIGLFCDAPQLSDVALFDQF